MSKSVENLFYGAPDDATHARDYKHGVDFYKRENGRWLYADKGSWKVAFGTSEKDCVERPQPKPWSGSEDGLPPVGTVCEVDHGNGKHWDKVTIVAHHREKAIYLDPVREIHYIWGLVKDFRAIRTQEQIVAEKRETAIRELMDIAQVDCRVTAARLVDAGFKRN